MTAFVSRPDLMAFGAWFEIDDDLKKDNLKLKVKWLS